MTKEHRILFELSDLKAIRLVCRECKDEVLYPIAGQRVFPPDNCPSCQAQMSKGSNALVGQLLRYIYEVVEKDEAMTVGLKFEMYDEE